MPLNRTSVRSGRSTGARSFGTYRGSSFAATSVASAPPSTKSTAAETSALTLQRWLTEHRITLQESQDKDALARLAKGDTSYFITYSERRLQEVAGDQDQTAYWTNLHDEAISKAEDNYVAGAIDSGELKLEDALKMLVDRRARVNPGDQQFVAINQQIAKIHNAIDARDFNAAVSKAYGEFVDTGDKQKYLTALMGFKALAKDDTARKTLDTQITGLRTEIQKDEQVKAQAEVDKRFIDYYRNGDSTGLLNFLADKAQTAKSTTEANYYVELAGKVVAREDALNKQRISATAAANSPTAQKKVIDDAMRPARNDMASALDHIQAVIRDGNVPTASDWAIFWAAGDRVLAGDQAALQAGATGTNLDAVLKEQRAVAEQRDIQKKEAGVQVLKKMDDIKTVIAKLAADAKNTTGDTTTAADAAAAQIQKLRDLAESDFLKGTEAATTAQEKIIDARKPFETAYQDALGALIDPTQRKSFKQAMSMYDAYVNKYEKVVGDGKYAQFDEWQKAMSSGADAATIAGMLGLATADGSNNGFTQANVDAALRVRDAAAAEKEALSKVIINSGKIVPDLIAQNGIALAQFGYAGGGRIVPGYNAPPVVGPDAQSRAGGAGKPGNASLIPPADLATRPVNEMAPVDTGTFAPPEVPTRQVNDVAPTDTGTYDPYATPMPTRPVSDVSPFDSGSFAPPPAAGPGGEPPPPSEGISYDAGSIDNGPATGSPQTPDAASRNLDMILGTTPPEWQTAFDYLHSDTNLNMPSWEVPDLPPEPSFLPSGDISPDAGFTTPVPVLDQGSYAGDTTGITHGH